MVSSPAWNYSFSNLWFQNIEAFGSCPHPAVTRIDVLLPNSSLNPTFLNTCSKYIFEFTDLSNQTNGRSLYFTTPTQAIMFSPWAFLYSIKVCGLDGAQCQYVCLFGDCFKTNHFSSDQITLWSHSSSKFSQKVHASNLGSLLTGLKHCVRRGVYARFRLYLKTLKIAP